ncbi:MAG TPA: ABC transporter substrate-binding protein [Acidimicrobiales bacterium]
MSLTRRLKRLLGLVAVLALFVSACGDDDDGGAAPEDGSTTSEAATTTVPPRSGGTVTFGSFVPLGGFDPAAQSRGTFGCCGGTELLAMYDLLVTFNAETGEYEGRIAESLEPNADFTEWTLKLRPGVKFADGTDLDAEAVIFNVERHRAPSATSAAKPILTRFLDTMTAVDETTVLFELKEAWSGFPTLLAREVGMIASPAAVQAAGQNFATAPGPAGAGPFMLSSFKPGESIELVKNPNYWGGEVYLDGLRFVQLGSEANTYEALKAGDVQAMYTRNPEVIATARDEGTPDLFLTNNPMSIGVVFNSGVAVTCSGGEPAVHCAGRPDGATVTSQPATADLTVRQAIAAAIDPNVINERVFNGKAEATTELFPDVFPWSPGVPGPTYDPERATQLVEQAKARGWDGSVNVRVPNTLQEMGVALQTMLELAGISVELSNQEDTNALVSAVLLRKDFEMAQWSLGLSDEMANNYAQLSISFQGAQTRYGYSSPELDAALEELRVAATIEEQEEAMRKATEVLMRDLPFLSFAVGEEVIIHSEDLHGIESLGHSRVSFAKAFLAR